MTRPAALWCLALVVAVPLVGSRLREALAAVDGVVRPLWGY